MVFPLRFQNASLFLSLALSLPLLANVSGADARLTGAPGEQTCVACHTGTALNSGPGSVKLTVPGGTTYVPGVKQRLTITVADPSQRRWGFSLSARLKSNLSGGQAGTLAAADSNAQVVCQDGRAAPCSSAAVLQFATHTQAGTRAGTTGSVSFDVDWTPPGTDVGNVVLYAAGNAANGNNSDAGDRIYTTSVELSPAITTTGPTINSAGVVNAASFQPVLSQSSWVTIVGTNLSASTRSWSAEELAGGTLPTALDGVSVTINNKPALVQYISPKQINVVAPADDAIGPVEVRVRSNGQDSAGVAVTMQKVSPSFFTFDGKYLAATHADNTWLGKAGLFSAAPTSTTPAKPGEIVVLYGNGLGATSPAIASDKITDTVAPLLEAVTVSIGGQPASVHFAGLVAPFARMYQINVQVPDSLPSGDHAVVIQTGGVSSLATAECCFISVQ
jgi:uncharacterized protein (TIGR03437 family)